MIDITSLTQFVVRLTSKASRWFKADYLDGIKHRMWLAGIVSILVIVIDIILDMLYIDYLPAKLPFSFDWDGNPISFIDKDTVWDYDLIYFSLFLFILILCYAINKLPFLSRWSERHWGANGKLLQLRTSLLLLDLFMLLITTAFTFSLVILGLSKDKISDAWEYIVLFFWTIVQLFEYRGDLKIIKNTK